MRDVLSSKPNTKAVIKPVVKEVLSSYRVRSVSELVDILKILGKRSSRPTVTKVLKDLDYYTFYMNGSPVLCKSTVVSGVRVGVLESVPWTPVWCLLARLGLTYGDALDAVKGEESRRLLKRADRLNRLLKDEKAPVEAVEELKEALLQECPFANYWEIGSNGKPNT